MSRARSQRPRPRPCQRPCHRQRGIAAILAMLFLVIFASLATAMAIVAQGNLRTADSHLKMNRSLAAAETGMRFLRYRVDDVIRSATDQSFHISQGEVTEDIAAALWPTVVDTLVDSLDGDGIGFGSHHLAAPQVVGDIASRGSGSYVHIGPVRVAPGEPVFTAVLIQHPIPATLPDTHPFYGHSYDSDYYRRPPYDASDERHRRTSGITTPVTATTPLGEQWVRLRVTAIDGPFNADGTPLPAAVTRTISVDLKMEKRIRAAMLSKSRVMVGRNVMIEGRIGSQFRDVHLLNGHPVQLESDFRGLEQELNDKLDLLLDDVIEFDANGDNRLALGTEINPITEEIRRLDYDGDGYIDEWDVFLGHFDPQGNGHVSRTDFNPSDDLTRDHLWNLIQEMKYPPGTEFDWTSKRVKLPGNENWVDASEDLDVLGPNDRYSKVRGEVIISANLNDWENGAAGGPYQQHFQGPIRPGYGEAPVRFGADDSEFPDFDQKSFDVRVYRNQATNDVWSYATDPSAAQDPTPGAPAPEFEAASESTREEVPFGANYPYDYYDRHVFRNMVFRDLFIPRGTNALFINCTFKGVTYVETHQQNNIPHPLVDTNAFNYSGRIDRDGTPIHPDIDEHVRNTDSWPSGAQTTKDLGNNIRFDSCRFEGVVVSGSSQGYANQQPDRFSHTRNKLTFTGTTEFPDVNDRTSVPDISDAERNLYRRGRIITPHMSVEMGTFLEPHNNNETVKLTGTIVAGLIDMRGQIDITGTVMTTYMPTTDDGTVMGETSPQFNTTLGYFSRDAGDLEAELPPTGMGNIKVRYDPTLPLPDGVMARIEMTPIISTYFESTGR